MPSGSRGRARGLRLLAPARLSPLLLSPLLLALALLAACSSPAATSTPDPTSPPGQASAGQHSSDPLCERFAGIYATWASAWKRDVDRRLEAGVELDRAQERANRSLIAPFRRAVLAEIGRDAETAVDPALIAAMNALSTAPEDQSGFERLASVCGAVGPIPEAR